jgi:hypothetical protein
MKFGPFCSYVIWDSKNNLFWEKNLSYGYNWQNQAVFEARFVSDLKEANFMPRPKAHEILDRFKNEPHIVGGRYKEADTTNLQVVDSCSFISKEDLEYLKGEPAPLVITIPGIKIKR